MANQHEGVVWGVCHGDALHAGVLDANNVNGVEGPVKVVFYRGVSMARMWKEVSG